MNNLFIIFTALTCLMMWLPLVMIYYHVNYGSQHKWQVAKRIATVIVVLYFISLATVILQGKS